MTYACTKTPVLNFTCLLAKELAKKNPGQPGYASLIWTPLIPTTFKPDELKTFGNKTLFKRPGQSAEVAIAYLFLATEADASFITGQVLHVNGGQGMMS